jgi:hypothetical protein
MRTTLLTITPLNKKWENSRGDFIMRRIQKMRGVAKLFQQEFKE